MGTPAFATSKMPTVRPGTVDAARPAMRMLLLVPMLVHEPPRMMAKESGIMKRVGAWFFWAHHCSTRGMHMAIKGVLFIHAERNAAGSSRRR